MKGRSSLRRTFSVGERAIRLLQMVNEEILNAQVEVFCPESNCTVTPLAIVWTVERKSQKPKGAVQERLLVIEYNFTKKRIHPGNFRYFSELKCKDGIRNKFIGNTAMLYKPFLLEHTL
jgi:hypothetical protein